MKKVTIGLTVDSHFVKLLQAEAMMGQLAERDRLTPGQQLALVALAEFRGAIPEQTHAAIPPCWRPHIEANSRARVVVIEPGTEGDNG